MASYMEQAAPKLNTLVKIMASVLVDDSAAIVVKSELGENTLVLHLSCDKSDLGKIIGKQGANISAIRQIVKCASIKYHVRAVVLLDE